MNNGQSRSSPVDPPAYAATLATACPHEPGPEDPGLWRRRLRHDIRHELGTIIMLASAMAVAGDVGPASRERVEQLLGETRWLDHLLRQLDEENEGDEAGTARRQPPSPERIRVDALAAEVVTGMRLATPHEVCFTGDEAWAHMDPVALWRALRNVLDNACRVAAGRVDVRVTADQGWVAVQVDDDGPGFGAGKAGLASLGLGIVHDLISGYGGGLEIRTCEMGGARVRVLLPAAPPAETVPGGPVSGGSVVAGVAAGMAGADDWRPHP